MSQCISLYLPLTAKNVLFFINMDPASKGTTFAQPQYSTPGVQDPTWENCTPGKSGHTSGYKGCNILTGLNKNNMLALKLTSKKTILRFAYLSERSMPSNL